MKVTFVRQHGHELYDAWQGRATRFWDMSVVSPEETFIPWQLAHIPETFIVAADETVTINEGAGASTITFAIGNIPITIETGTHRHCYYVWVANKCVAIAETWDDLVTHVRTIVRTLRAIGVE